jgi:hypothetical protein
VASQTPPRSSRGEGRDEEECPPRESAAGGTRVSQAATLASPHLQNANDNRTILEVTARMIVSPQDLQGRAGG